MIAVSTRSLSAQMIDMHQHDIQGQAPHLKEQVPQQLRHQCTRRHEGILQLQRIHAQGHAVDLDDAHAEGGGEAVARPVRLPAAGIGIRLPHTAAMRHQREVAANALQVQLLKVPLAADAALDGTRVGVDGCIQHLLSAKRQLEHAVGSILQVASKHK